MGSDRPGDERASAPAGEGAAAELSGLKRTERALRAALAEAEKGRRLLEALMEHVPEGITIADAPDVRIRMVSRYGRELTGKPRSALEGIAAGEHAQRWDLYEADGATVARDEDLPLTRATRGGEVVRDEEWVLGTPDGARIPILCNAGPIRDEAGAIVGGVIAYRDVTERKRAAEALHESEEKFRAAFATAAIGFAIADLEGRFLDANPAFCALTGRGLDELRGKAFPDVVHPEDLAAEHARVERMLRGEIPGFVAEGRYRTADGRAVWVRMSVSLVRAASGAPRWILALVEDVSAARRANEERERLVEALRETDRRRTEFLAVLSHELRNPLAPIRNSLYVLERADPGGEEARRARVVMSRQVDQLARLVDDLLDVSRMATSKVQLRMERVELGELARRVSDDHRSVFAHAGVELRFRPPAAPVHVEGDPGRLAQVVGNLLQNATKFTPAGGHVSIEVVRDGPGGRAVLRVSDDGIGMTSDTLAHLFQPFVQAETALDRGKGGLGLGLALARGLVELHGGTVDATSPGLGKGATLVVCLPLEAGPRAEGPGDAPGAASGGPLRILIIEDNVDAAESLRDLLALEGHELAVAHDGPSGFRMAAAFRPQLVFCDIGLPGMDGYEVARAFRADERLCAVPLVALTGYALPEDQERCARAGFSRHLSKPLGVEALRAILAELRRPG